MVSGSGASGLDLLDVLDAFAVHEDVGGVLSGVMRNAYEWRWKRWNFMQFAVANQSLLRRGLAHDRVSIRRDAALFAAMDLDLAARAIHDPDPGVRSRGASSRLASAVALATAGRDPHVEVRRAVAQNLHTPVNTLIRLLSDVDEDVRVDAAEHPLLPPVVKRLLERDDWPDDIALVGDVITQRLTSRVLEV